MSMIVVRSQGIETQSAKPDLHSVRRRCSNFPRVQTAARQTRRVFIPSGRLRIARRLRDAGPGAPPWYPARPAVDRHALRVRAVGEDLWDGGTGRESGLPRNRKLELLIDA